MTKLKINREDEKKDEFWQPLTRFGAIKRFFWPFKTKMSCKVKKIAFLSNFLTVLKLIKIINQLSTNGSLNAIKYQILLKQHPIPLQLVCYLWLMLADVEGIVRKNISLFHLGNGR